MPPAQQGKAVTSASSPAKPVVAAKSSQAPVAPPKPPSAKPPGKSRTDCVRVLASSRFAAKPPKEAEEYDPKPRFRWRRLFGLAGLVAVVGGTFVMVNKDERLQKAITTRVPALSKLFPNTGASKSAKPEPAKQEKKPATDPNVALANKKLVEELQRKEVEEKARHAKEHAAAHRELTGVFNVEESLLPYETCPLESSHPLTHMWCSC